MRIFITGGKGFIGDYLCERLSLNQVKTYDLENGFDIRDRARLDKEIECFQPDVIIHLAALAGVRRGEQYPAEYYSTNVIGTENVFSLAKKHGVQKVISFSSSSVFNDDNELHPLSVYGHSKLFAEEIARFYSKSVPNVYVVRPFTVYGINGRGDQVIYKWLSQIEKGQPITFYGDGNTFRPYTWVSELAEAVVKMIERDLGFQIFNISGKDSITLRELLTEFQKSFEGLRITQLPLPEADSQGKLPDSSNWDLLDYQPTADFRKILLSIILNHKNNG